MNMLNLTKLTEDNLSMQLTIKRVCGMLHCREDEILSKITNLKILLSNMKGDKDNEHNYFLGIIQELKKELAMEKKKNNKRTAS